MKTAWSTLPADSAMVMDAQRKTEPGEFDACFSEASAGPVRWGSFSSGPLVSPEGAGPFYRFADRAKNLACPTSICRPEGWIAVIPASTISTAPVM